MSYYLEYAYDMDYNYEDTGYNDNGCAHQSDHFNDNDHYLAPSDVNHFQEDTNFKNSGTCTKWSMDTEDQGLRELNYKGVNQEDHEEIGRWEELRYEEHGYKGFECAPKGQQYEEMGYKREYGPGGLEFKNEHWELKNGKHKGYGPRDLKYRGYTIDVDLRDMNLDWPWSGSRTFQIQSKLDSKPEVQVWV